MDVLLQEGSRGLTAELEAAGHTVGLWSPGDELPPSTQLVIVDGLDSAAETQDLACHIMAIVEPAELSGLADCPREITDLVVKPIHPGELVARLALIAELPSWRQTIHNRLLASAVENASDVFEVGTTGAVLEYVNPSYERLLGVSKEQAIGMTPAQLVRSDQHNRAFWQDVSDTLGRGDPWQGVMISRARDGRLVHFDTTITPVRNSKGKLTHHVAVKRDITERLARQRALEQSNRALTQARDAAVAASRAKSEFLANMSHELRTPLNAIIGYSELLLEDHEGDPGLTTDLGRIHSSGSHLLSLINDVLDISKIEADKIELFPEHLELDKLIASVAATIEPLAAKNHNRFEVTKKLDVGSIKADHTRLQQILLNLLSNACKFTSEGTVTLEVRSFMRDGLTPWLEFSIADTGIGISEAQKKRLFQPFVQADSSTTREYGGTGLGLVISKRLVELMGGEITLDSALDRGSTFTVQLPVDPSTTDILVEPEGGGDATVLLIDDDPNIRDLFTRVLSRRGFRVQVAASGAKGIEYATRVQPDAIVLDVKMPGMSGWDVLSALKLSEATAKIPVVMLTVLRQREVGQALGAVDYLIKPIDPELLSTTLRRHIPKRTAKILVIEDDEPTRELMRRTLEAAGHHVTEARNGQEGLTQLESSPADLVVLDLMMPVMDGFTFLHHIRRSERFSELPVIVATARVLSTDERAELDRLAQRILEKKALGREELLELIGDQVRRMVKVRPGDAG